MSLPIMIFAAGFGTRMRHLTKDTPKPLLKAGGITMLDRAIGFALEARCDPIVVNSHYLADVLENHLATHWREQVVIAHEPEILDTGGGLKAARHLLGGDAAITLNADTIFGARNPLVALRDAWRPDEMDALMLLTPAKDALAYTRQGDFFLEGAAPKRRGKAPEAPYIYAGAQVLKLSALDAISDQVFSLNAVWDELAQRDGVQAVVYEDRWIDVGTPEGLAIADEALRNEL